MTRRTFALTPAAALAAQGAQDPLDSRVKSATASFKGTIAFHARNLDTGRTYSLNPDEKVRTASTIKLPIMTAVFDLVESGKVKWTDESVLRDVDKVSGSGVLHEFSDGARINLRDLVHLMIVVSDNTATNLVLDRVAADAVNAYMDKLGFPNTRSMRKVRGDGNDLKAPEGWSAAGRLPENQRFGLGSSTPREMVALLEKLEAGQVVSPAASREMIEILKRQQDRNGIARRLKETPVASKTGALDHLRSDVSIVYSSRGRVAMAITCDNIPDVDYGPDNEGLLQISKLAGVLLDGLGR
jgi:beta-lactamase class A